MTQVTVDQAMQLATMHQRAGRLAEAGAIYRQILSARPDHPHALHGLALVAARVGRLDEAISLYQSALANDPAFADAHFDLGNALKGLGRLDQAIACYEQAVAHNPGFVEALTNLGNAFMETGQPDRAVLSHQRALAVRPDYPEAHNNIGLAWKAKGEIDKAIAAHQKAIELRPDYPKALCNLGNAWKDKGDLDQAIACYQRAIALDSDLAEAHSNLGVAWNAKHKFDPAIESYRRALAFNPGLANVHTNLANALRDTGQIDQAVASCRHAVELDPGSNLARENLLFTLQFHPATNPQALLVESRLWNDRHARPLARFIQPHTNDRDPGRRLRVGYVSPDFRDHCQAMFTIPLLQHHDRGQFEIFCYSSVIRPDEYTRRIASNDVTWRDVRNLPDAPLCDLIRADRIDILVDLTLHMAGNRLLAFAHKPAPVQVTWLGYPGTTGMDAIDYRLTDPWLDPPAADTTCYSERSIRLPETFWCYDPLTTEPQVGAAPSLQAGFITFGCLNNFSKVNDAVLSLWARVLLAIPTSRLILLVPEGRTTRQVQERLAQLGVAADRLECVPHRPRFQYLQTYSRIDIALDTFPSNGHTTSLDALWMGVPVVTLVGATLVGRAGLSQLTNLDLPELIAHTPDQYVQIATDLAADPARLAHLRATLRQRMETSPLMDARRFARAIEAAYRTMWRAWCAI